MKCTGHRTSPGATSIARWASTLFALCCGAPSAFGQLVDDTPDREFDATSTNSGATFGSSLALDADWLAISDRSGMHPMQSGAVTFWRRGIDGYDIAQQVLPTACYAGGSLALCGFGREVAIDGPIAVVSSNGGEVSGGSKGLAHVYRRSGEHWGLVDIIRAPIWTIAAPSGFGRLALEGETLAVGATGFQVPGLQSRGAVHIFEPDAADRWLETQRLIHPPPYGPFTDIGFGYSLSMENDVLAVGAPTFGWRVIIYKRQAGVWVIDQQVIYPLTNGPNSTPSRTFGTTVRLDPTANVLAVSDGGRVFVFERDPVTDRFEFIDQLEPLEGSDPGFTPDFGTAIGIANGLLAIAAPNERVNGFRTGAVEIFRRGTSGWVRDQRLAPPQATPTHAALGTAVAVDDSRVLTSEQYWVAPNGSFPGRAYLWEFSSGTEVCAQSPGTPALKVMFDDSERERLTASVSSLPGRGIGVFVAGLTSPAVAYGSGELCVGRAQRISGPIPFVEGQEWVYADLMHPDWTAPLSTAFQFVYSRRDGVFPQGSSSARVVD